AAAAESEMRLRKNASVKWSESDSPRLRKSGQVTAHKLGSGCSGEGEATGELWLGAESGGSMGCRARRGRAGALRSARGRSLRQDKGGGGPRDERRLGTFLDSVQERNSSNWRPRATEEGDMLDRLRNAAQASKKPVVLHHRLMVAQLTVLAWVVSL